MIERRKDRRSISDLSGMVVFNRRTSGNCLIRDTSTFAARIILQGATQLPHVFELHVPDRQALYRAYTKWRRHHEVGVKLERLVAPQRPVAIRAGQV